MISIGNHSDDRQNDCITERWPIIDNRVCVCTCSLIFYAQLIRLKMLFKTIQSFSLHSNIIQM